MTALVEQNGLWASPEACPLAVDPSSGVIDLVALSPVDYEKASFLDGRLQARRLGQAKLDELARDADASGVACDWIFHVGHVGSTLLSRLLGTHPRVFSVREPQPLRTFAQVELDGIPWRGEAWERRLHVLLALLSRTWRGEQRSLVKATSLVSEIAPQLLAAEPASKALLMSVRPERYLATILGGLNSRVELKAALPVRAARLDRRLGGAGWRAEQLSEGEAAALSWACEMTSLAPVAGARAAWIDFDRFLADPAAGIASALRQLHGRAEPLDVARIAASPYLQRYSKAPEYAYGPGLRAQILDRARHEHGEEIGRGMAWLEQAAAQAPIAAALQTAEEIARAD